MIKTQPPTAETQLVKPFLTQKLRPIWIGLLTLISIAGSLSVSAPATAAEKLVISYGPLNASLAIQDLEALVQTQAVSDSLKFYLGLANLDPALLRQLLSMEIGASTGFMQGMLDSESGAHLLSQISEVIHLPPDRPAIQLLKSTDHSYTEPTETENISALRTALVTAADDRQVTVLEVLQQYPTERVYLDAAKLIRFANSLEDEITQPE